MLPIANPRAPPHCIRCENRGICALIQSWRTRNVVRDALQNCGRDTIFTSGRARKTDVCQPRRSAPPHRKLNICSPHAGESAGEHTKTPRTNTTRRGGQRVAPTTESAASPAAAALRRHAANACRTPSTAYPSYQARFQLARMRSALTTSHFQVRRSGSKVTRVSSPALASK